MEHHQARRQAISDLTAALLQQAMPGLALALVRVASQQEDNALRGGIFDALEQVNQHDTMDELWAAWAEMRLPALERCLVDKGQIARYPLVTRVLSALKLGQVAFLEDAGPEAVEALLSACTDADQQIALDAQNCLAKLKNPAAQEEVCRLALEHDHPTARQAAIKGKYAPRDPYRRALFFLLTEQWGNYRELDFDGSLLRTAYQAADAQLRQHISGLARRSGWTGYIELAASRSRSLDQLTPTEWEVVLAILSRSQRQADLWRLAQAAPPLRSALLIQELHQSHWLPESPEEQQGFRLLAEKASACQATGVPIERLVEAPLTLSRQPSRISCLAFNHQGDWLTSGSMDGLVHLWAGQGFQEEMILQGHTGYIASLAFSPDGEWLASGSSDHSARLWSAASGKAQQALGAHASEVIALAFNPDKAILASGDKAGVRLWDYQTGRLLHMLAPQAAETRALGFSPDGTLLAHGSADHQLSLWSPDSGELARILMEKTSLWLFISPTGTSKADLATTSPYGRLRLWKAGTGELCETLHGRVDGRLLAVSAQGGVAAASDHGAVQLWKLPCAQPVGRIEQSGAPLTALALSPDGRLLAGGYQDRRLAIWQIPEGRLVYESSDFEASVQHMRFSPHGNCLVCADGQRIRYWPLSDLGMLWLSTPQRLHDENLELVQQRLHGGPYTVERAWLDFSSSLLNWYRRYEIEVAAAGETLRVGNFDIEIEG